MFLVFVQTMAKSLLLACLLAMVFECTYYICVAVCGTSNNRLPYAFFFSSFLWVWVLAVYAQLYFDMSSHSLSMNFVSHS